MGKVVFSSDMLPPGLNDQQRFLAWREHYNEFVGSGDFAASDAPFDAKMEFAPMHDVVLGRASATVRESVHGGRRARSSDEGRIGLVFNCGDAPMHVQQRGRDEILQSDAPILLSRTDQGRFTFPQHRSKWMLIDLPEDAVLRLAPKAEDIVGTRLRAGGEALRMISAYFEMMFAQDEITDPLVTARILQTLIDLVGLALGAEKEAAAVANERGLRAARLDAVVREIAAGYLDPSFSIGAVSIKLRLSPRYIQDLLQITGVGFADRVLELRLQHSVGLLAQASAGAVRKVSDIAYSCAFNDLSYFHRCFRRRFGITPSGLRAA